MKRRKKERKKERKMKKMKRLPTLQLGRFLLLFGIPLSRGHSMAMEISPNIGASSKQFETNCGAFLGTFGSRNCCFGAG